MSNPGDNRDIHEQLQTSALPTCSHEMFSAPARAEYHLNRVLWVVDRFAELALEFPGLTPEKLADFHTLVCGAKRPWTALRRLFGVRPQLPGMAENADDCRLWRREELAEAWGITKPKLQSELDALRGLSTQLLAVPEPVTAPPEVTEKLESESRPGELNLDVPALLREHNLNLGISDTADRDWFHGRVRDYAPVLKVAMAKGLARNCVMAEWQIYQLEKVINDPEKNKVGEKNWSANMVLLGQMRLSFNKDFAELIKLLPWAGAIAGQYDFVGCLSDLTRAIQEYETRRETTLVDGMFAAMEIQVELRRSTQAPLPRYRAGLVVYVNMARAHLMDPNWNPADHGLSPRDFKMMDEGFRAAAAQKGDAEGQTVPDLSKDGPEGEYEELVKTS